MAGAGAPWRSKVTRAAGLSCSLLVLVCGKAAWRAGVWSSAAHRFAHGGCWARPFASLQSLSQPVKWEPVGRLCPARLTEALSGPCTNSPYPTPASQRLSPAPRATEGPVHFPVSVSALQEFRSWEKLGRGGATSGYRFKCVCFHSLLSPGPQSSPRGKEGSFVNASRKAGAPRPHLSPPAPSWDPERAGDLLGATAIPFSDLCWFPLSPHPAAGGPASRMGPQPHFRATSGCQHLAKPAPL